MTHKCRRENIKSCICVTMACRGSIPMFFDPINRLQALILLPGHHVTHFGHTLLRAVGIFSQKIVKYCYTCYYGKWGLYSYVFCPNKSIATIHFTPKPSCDPFWPHPFARGGYFSSQNSQILLHVLLWRIGVLFLCFWWRGIDCNSLFYPQTNV
jgi:hypothetical protein